MRIKLSFSSFFLLLVHFLITSCATTKQQAYTGDWKAQTIKLPLTLEDYDNQFSGLAIANDSLYLLPECRLQEKQRAVLYSMALPDLDKAIAEPATTVVYGKIPIEGLSAVYKKINANGDAYEGLEAIAIHNGDCYISIETATPSNFAYIVKGKLQSQQLVLDTASLLPVAKPTKSSGEHIYNASFESMLFINERLFCFFEYNNFPQGNYAYNFNADLLPASKDSVSMQQLLFRITDITKTGSSSAVGINFFYNGGGKDTVYRPLPADGDYQWVHNQNGFTSRARLIDLKFQKSSVSYKTLGELPSNFTGNNWEGIAAYKNGFFLINDKYTLLKPYESILLYVTPK